MEGEMTEGTKVWWFGGEYSREDLTQMDPVALRALLRERTHHTIEVPLYPTLLKGKERQIKDFGLQAQMAFDVWKERGFIEDAPDIEWVKRYLTIAEKMRSGEKVQLVELLPTPFTDQEMAVVDKLIYGRRSVREWVEKEVSDDMIEKIMEAGRAAPIGCNLDGVCFIVLRTPEEHKMIWSDISTKNAVIIVLCSDTRVYEVVGHHRMIPQVRGFDIAAAADHMLLMAHALGLGGVWLTKTEETGKKFTQEYGLPDYLQYQMHIAVGWTAMGSIKSLRMPLPDMMVHNKI